MIRIACVLSLVFMAACGQEAESGPDRVVYGGSAWYGHAPVWVGIRLGIFKKHGFEVSKANFDSSSSRINALEAGNATFASLGEVATGQLLVHT